MSEPATQEGLESALQYGVQRGGSAPRPAMPLTPGAAGETLTKSGTRASSVG